MHILPQIIYQKANFYECRVEKYIYLRKQRVTHKEIAINHTTVTAETDIKSLTKNKAPLKPLWKKRTLIQNVLGYQG
jgi:hypothetical protein